MPGGFKTFRTNEGGAMTDTKDGYVPTVDSVLEAVTLLESFERHDPAFGPQLLAATTGTTYALVTLASQAVNGFAKLADDTPDAVLHELRLITTEVVALMASDEGA